MKLLSITCMILILLLPACRKDKIDHARISTFDLTSSVNGSTYQIKVALPKHFSTDRTYKTLYVLDPKTDFNLVASECDKKSSDLNKEEILVVGIGGGNNRLDDYFPVPYKGHKGAADKFIQFIQQELIPKMEKDFHASNTRADRAMIGHSAGGLCVAYCFTNYPGIFGNYLCLSPSLWLGNQIVLKNEKAHRAINQTSTGVFFLAAGELEEEIMRPPIALLDQILQQHYNGFTKQYHLARGLDHLGSKTPNIKQAVAFYFQQL
ncbi:hypothetical protein SAMN04488122_6653 [Chitinophaga arvensicola]|uniref:Esterase n=2 Tax=Chitinophaga arvensicola TaxID=29529 RepID=A0A1I0SFT4_9BACT|nr:hypothetical protein SAMN04488122_6653 [Chitinophaga arvensicola]